MRRLLVAVGTVLAVAALPGSAVSATTVVSGTVGHTAKEAFHEFTTAVPGPLRGSLDWSTTSANLDLELQRRSGTGWTTVARARTSARPEVVSVSAAPAATYRFVVRAAKGGSAYTLTRTVADAAPVADFAATPTAGEAPLAVAFTNLTTGEATSFTWTFGDGSTSSEPAPTHAYGTPGTYTVAMTASGPGGATTRTRAAYITVSAPPPPPPAAPAAAFAASPTAGEAPLAVAFQDRSTGEVTSWAWTFGDGTTSSVQSPAHTYADAGTYTVSLTVSGPGGQDTHTEAALVTVTAPAPPQPPASSSFVSVSLGRAMMGQADAACQLVPGAVSIFRLADELRARSIPGNTTATLSLVGDAGSPRCQGGQRYLDWGELAQLRDGYGWSVYSRGATGTDVRALSADEQRAETCGSLATFYAHGHTDAWAMYGYPNGASDATMQTAVVDTCFAFGRAYGVRVTPVPVPDPYLIRAYSITGGRCHDAALPCATVPVNNDRVYISPDDLIAYADAGAASGGTWSILQWYRIVEGSSGTTASSVGWDCTSPDWRQHWTKLPELYCLNDMLRVLDAIDPRVVPTSVVAMANRQGRNLAPPATG